MLAGKRSSYSNEIFFVKRCPDGIMDTPSLLFDGKPVPAGLVICAEFTLAFPYVSLASFIDTEVTVTACSILRLVARVAYPQCSLGIVAIILSR